MLNSKKATYFGFDVAPIEDYLYFITQENSLRIYILNTTDGVYVSSRSWSTYQINIPNLVLSVSLDSSTVYFTSMKSSPYLWKTTTSDLNFYWVTFTNEGNAHKILGLDSYQLFINIENDSQKFSLVKRIELNSTSAKSKWVTKIQWTVTVNAIVSLKIAYY